ncbi:MAG: indolepyruvate ferredoxin oxidoreductase family protein, partial [Hyphomicrobium sp.]
MSKRQASLSDKFELGEARQLLSGTQAIVRLCLMQRARDRAASLDTAGYVSGYRGSPIATIEQAFHLAGDIPAQNGILFHPAVNEDLAATAIWGTQQAELRGEGKHDGVFAIWYGKGPGVDRSGDAFRHANHAGTSRHGGVVALMGDDHTCESSTSAHQSEFAFLDAMIPILNPSGVQEILDYGLYGIALSRYAGVWVGLKCVKDNIESTATVDGRLDRVTIQTPGPDEFQMPPGGLNIRLGDSALAKEARLHEFKRDAILAFNRANHLDRIVFDGGPKPRIGIVTAGKSYLDTRQALDELGIDETRAAALGLRLYKVAMSWPLEPRAMARFVDGLELVLVIEEKRSLIESQFKEELYDVPVRPRVLGKKDEDGRWLFPVKAALDPLDIAAAIGDRIMRMGGDERLAAALAEINSRRASKPAEPEALVRIPYFCAGCPHNSSTVVPDGSRAYAGIGCHYMAQWMDRATDGFTQMGGEGANWIGEAPFSRRGHIFQNIGDGTYVHSGSLAIRSAVAARTTMTYKLLYNDAVAMTGGQPLEGGMTVGQMAAQLVAEGVARLDIVTDEPEKYPFGTFPSGVQVHHRRDLDAVQRTLAATPGVTVLIFDQTCAAEKRRRRKRGTMPEAPARAFINPLVCEGCGDCGRVSNCVAVTPLETPFGRKREIDQSACNKDMSCLEGFCP